MDASEFWIKEGLTYYDKFQNHSFLQKARFRKQEDALVKLVRNEIFHSILEVGCGFGRFTKILYRLFNPDLYMAVDVSEAQLGNAKRYVKNDNIDFQCVKIQDFHTDQKFDLVFASEVLMHISFNDIDKVVNKLMSFSRKKIVTVDWFNRDLVGQTKWQGVGFMHDYENLFKNNGAGIVKVHPVPLPAMLKLKGAYDKIRHKPKEELQAIIEVDI